jgi:hypothetical protein
MLDVPVCMDVELSYTHVPRRECGRYDTINHSISLSKQQQRHAQSVAPHQEADTRDMRTIVV